MKSYIFKIVVEQDAFEDGRIAYHASCPALKGCHTWGHTYQEALVNIREAGDPIPLDPDLGTLEFPTPSVAVNV